MQLAHYFLPPFILSTSAHRFHSLTREQFCATGTMGLSGNLTTGEILEQIVHADRILADEWQDRRKNATPDQSLVKLDFVRNVVFMGMGEVSVAQKRSSRPYFVSDY